MQSAYTVANVLKKLSSLVASVKIDLSRDCVKINFLENFVHKLLKFPIICAQSVHKNLILCTGHVPL